MNKTGLDELMAAVAGGQVPGSRSTLLYASMSV